MLTSIKKLQTENKINLYTYYSAKKIYLTNTKELLFNTPEVTKKDIKVLKLTPYHPIIINNKSGMLLFPKNKFE